MCGKRVTMTTDNSLNLNSEQEVRGPSRPSDATRAVDREDRDKRQ